MQISFVLSITSSLGGFPMCIKAFQKLTLITFHFIHIDFFLNIFQSLYEESMMCFIFFFACLQLFFIPSCGCDLFIYYYLHAFSLLLAIFCWYFPFFPLYFFFSVCLQISMQLPRSSSYLHTIQVLALVISFVFLSFFVEGAVCISSFWFFSKHLGNSYH